jgi:uncharacterized membrane-anchored protein
MKGTLMNKQFLIISIAIVLALFTGFMPMYLAYSSQSDKITVLESNETELVKANAAMIEEISKLRKEKATEDCD